MYLKTLVLYFEENLAKYILSKSLILLFLLSNVYYNCIFYSFFDLLIIDFQNIFNAL